MKENEDLLSDVCGGEMYDTLPLKKDDITSLELDSGCLILIMFFVADQMGNQ